MTEIISLTWKKSKVSPMFPNTAGSSEQRATGTPLFKSAGSGCINIDEVKRCSRLAKNSYRTGNVTTRRHRKDRNISSAGTGTDDSRKGRQNGLAQTC